MLRGALVLGLCGLPWAGARGSTLVSHSANAALIRASIDVGFVGAGSTGADRDADSQLAPFVLPAPGAIASAVVSASKAPASGSGTAAGSIVTQLTFGSGDFDAFDFTGSITLSALTALNAAGNPSAAEVLAGGAVTFYLDPGYGNHPITGLPTVAGDLVGQLLLAAPGPLDTYEVARKVSVVKDPSLTPVVLADLSAGDPGTAVDLTIGSEYRINFNYVARVPNGVDPDFNFSLTAGSTVVPEPSVLVGLLGLGAMGLFVYASRRRRSV
jgi:hypothetical protein